MAIITAALSAAAMVWTIIGYTKDCKLLEDRKANVSVRTYNSIKSNMDLAFYSSLVSYIIGILLSFMGWMGKVLKKVALQVLATFLGILLGFTSGVVAWILDLCYSLSYEGLKKKLGVIL